MQIHPVIGRLRSDPAPQPCTDAALAAWRRLPDVAAIAAALARFDAGAPLVDLPPLARITADHAAARGFVDSFVGPLMAAIRAEPLAQLPVGHAIAPGRARLRLASHGRSALTLVTLARRAPAQPLSVLFEHCTVHEIVVAGRARALLHRRSGARLSSAAITLTPGTALTLSGPHETRQITAITRPLMVLQLTREAAAPAPSQEIALAGGTVIKSISGCKATGQQIMALGVLGALAHRPALAEMERIARNRAGLRDLRWEALRQCLALDSERGLVVLAEVAARGDDPLCQPAAALQRQLLIARPELAALTGGPERAALRTEPA